MYNYEIRFACRMRDGSLIPYTRIIAAACIETAQRVAGAMVGECVDVDRILDAVESVVVTERSASVARTPDGYYALWGRVFRALGLSLDAYHLCYGTEIGLGTNPTGHVVPHVAQCMEPEIVGFFPWPAPKEPNENY